MKEPKWLQMVSSAQYRSTRSGAGLVSGHTTDVGSDGGDAAAEECKELEVPNLDIGVHTVHNILRCSQGF